MSGTVNVGVPHFDPGFQPTSAKLFSLGLVDRFWYRNCTMLDGFETSTSSSGIRVKIGKQDG